jgi:DNA invertase Pin-like site-specific DNA recombinase
MTKVEDQARISRGVAERLGWRIAEGVGYPGSDGVYTDNNKSAWQKNRKRPGWNQMLADVGEGKINAIIVYHGDRLVRRPEDLTDLIRLADNKGVKLASPTGTHNLDNQRLELWIRAAFAEEESTRTSERKKSEYERLRRAGRVRPGGRGGRTFGFATDGITHVPEEAAIVREVNARVLGGEGVRAIAASLAARGVTTVTGQPMHPIAIRRMIQLCRYAGLMPDGEQAGAWEAIVPQEDWEAARAVIAARSGPVMAGHNARRYLLSGIARCGLCSSPMQAFSAYTEQRGGREVRVAATYGCVKPGCRKVYRSLAMLDAYVSRRVVNRLGNPLNPPAEILAGGGLAAEYGALTERRAEVEAAIADPGRGGLAALLARLDGIDARLAELRELASDDGRARIMTAHAGITFGEFSELPLATRRALVSACYRVTVLPASKRGPGFRTEDVLLSPQ